MTMAKYQPCQRIRIPRIYISFRFNAFNASAFCTRKTQARIFTYPRVSGDFTYRSRFLYIFACYSIIIRVRVREWLSATPGHVIGQGPAPRGRVVPRGGGGGGGGGDWALALALALAPEGAPPPPDRGLPPPRLRWSHMKAQESQKRRAQKGSYLSVYVRVCVCAGGRAPARRGVGS